MKVLTEFKNLCAFTKTEVEEWYISHKNHISESQGLEDT